MKYNSQPYIIILLMLLQLSCVKPYEPPAIQGPNDFLVVEGVINCNPQDVSTFSLSHSRPLDDTVLNRPELQAQVLIENAAGTQYPLHPRGGGIYISDSLTLNQSAEYRLRIILGNKTYLSATVPVVHTGAIDSIHWTEADNSIYIYVDAHDAQNNTRYYRWNFTETWEYHSFYDSFLDFRNGVIVFRDSADQITYCWKNAYSTDLLLHSTTHLSEDRVKDFLITTLPSASSKLQEKYSIRVNQYGLTNEAYAYWKILQRNTEQLGSIFDAQPSQLRGNIHNTNDDEEPVIGYVSAATIPASRIFIRRSQIVNGYHPASDCKAIITTPDSAAYYLSNPLLGPAYYISGGGIALSTKECIDCRLQGGTTQKPDFWQ